MKFKNEGDVKKFVKKVLNECDSDTIPKDAVWWFMPAANGFGKAGVPDFIGCFKGNMFAIETKFGRNELTEMQIRQLHHLIQAGAKTWIVRETSVDTWEAEFKAWVALCS